MRAIITRNKVLAKALSAQMEWDKHKNKLMWHNYLEDYKRTLYAFLKQHFAFTRNNRLRSDPK